MGGGGRGAGRGIGADVFPNPTDVWVAALGACVAYYAGKYLRAHYLLPGVTVTTTFKMGIGPARVARIEILAEAPGLAEDHREGFREAIEGCTIHNSLKSPPQVTITGAGPS